MKFKIFDRKVSTDFLQRKPSTDNYTEPEHGHKVEKVTEELQATGFLKGV